MTVGCSNVNALALKVSQPLPKNSRFSLLFIYRSLTIGMCSILVSFYLANPRIPFISYNITYKWQQNVPQSWGFFTKHARDSFDVSYYLNPETCLYQQVEYSNNSAKNFFGMSRNARRVAVETYRLRYFGSLQNQSSTESRSSVYRHAKYFKYLDVGTYKICRSRPVPWAYSKFAKDYGIATTCRYVELVK